MKKIACILISLLLIISCFSLYAFADAGVPQEVLDATESVIRVVSEYSDGYALGSGFVIKSDDQDTLIVTNHHVIADNPLSIAIFTESGIKVTVTVLLDDPEVDLCVLRLPYPNSQLHALVLNRDGIQRGAAVYAVGFPGAADDLALSETYSSETATITTGIISAIRTTYAIEGGRQFEMLQTTATINHGNSGGPLFDSSGYVVGINTYKAGESEGIFGAVSVGELIDLLTVNGISYRLPEPPKSVNVYVIIGAAAAALLLIAFIFLRLIRRKRRSEQIADDKNDLETQAEVFERDGAAEQNSAASKKPKEPFHIKRRHVFAGILAALLIALGLTAWQYESRYQEAVKLADAGEFSKASDTLILPFVTKLHDQKLMEYLEAGNLFESGQYEEAKVLFSNLNDYHNAAEMASEADYRKATELLNNGEYEQAKELFVEIGDYKNASEMAFEADYRKGTDLLDNGDYQSAYNIFRFLYDKDYSDSDKMAEAALFYWSTDYLEQDDLLNAYAVMRLGADLPDINEELPALKETIYNEAVSLYRSNNSGNYSNRFNASILFYTIYPYKKSKEYIILLQAEGSMFLQDKARCEIYNVTIVENKEEVGFPSADGITILRRKEIDNISYTYSDVLKLIDFEDAKKVIDTSYKTEYLNGNWKSKNEDRIYTKFCYNILYTFEVNDKQKGSNYQVDFYFIEIVDKDTFKATFYSDKLGEYKDTLIRTDKK